MRWKLEQERFVLFRQCPINIIVRVQANRYFLALNLLDIKNIICIHFRVNCEKKKKLYKKIVTQKERINVIHCIQLKIEILSCILQHVLKYLLFLIFSPTWYLCTRKYFQSTILHLPIIFFFSFLLLEYWENENGQPLFLLLSRGTISTILQ